MNVLGINGSARKDGNTAILIRTVFEELEKEGIGTDLVQLPDFGIAPCRLCEGGTCLACIERGGCVFRNDDFHFLADKVRQADGLVLGSPVYGADISSKMKVFIDRLGISSLGDEKMLRRKPGVVVHSAAHTVGSHRLLRFSERYSHAPWWYNRYSCLLDWHRNLHRQGIEWGCGGRGFSPGHICSRVSY